MLLERLAALAAAHGFRRFEATTLRRQRGDARCVPRIGLRDPIEVGPRLRHVGCRSTPVGRGGRRRPNARRRSRRSTSMRPLLAPRAVAVIGASRDADSIGRRVLDALVDGRLHRPVYPGQSARRPRSTGCACYASVADVPRGVDLAVVAVPREPCSTSSTSARRPASSRWSSITAGFAEIGDDGRALQQRLVEQGARPRHADGRARTAWVCSTRARRAAERVVLADRAAGRPRRVLVAERRARPRHPRARDRTAASACRRSSASATRPTCRATICSSTWEADAAHAR